MKVKFFNGKTSQFLLFLFFSFVDLAKKNIKTKNKKLMKMCFWRWSAVNFFEVSSQASMCVMTLGQSYYQLLLSNAFLPAQMLSLIAEILRHEAIALPILLLNETKKKRIFYYCWLIHIFSAIKNYKT